MSKPTKNLLIRGDWSDPNLPWLEEHIQAAIVMKLRQAKIDFEVGMEGVRLSKSQRGKAKIQGMEPGRCDLKILLPGPHTLHIELKRGSGRVSPDQTRWHDRLRAMGFEVHVVKARTPAAGIEAVNDILSPYLQCPAPLDVRQPSCVRG